MRRTVTAVALAVTMLTQTALAAEVAFPPETLGGGSPSGLTAAENGGYLLTDTFQRILWKVEPDGTVSRFAGQISVAGLDGQPLARSETGTRETAFFSEPWDIAPFLEGWAVTDAEAHLLRYVDQNGVHALAGSGKPGNRDGQGTQASFCRPTGLATDDQGNLYVSDTGNGLIRKVNRKRKVETVCDGLNEPTGLCWHGDSLYIAETGAHRVLRWDGSITVLAGGEPGFSDGLSDRAKFSSPQDVAVDDSGVIYIADTGNGSVRRLRDSRVTTLLESGTQQLTPVLPRSLLVQGTELLITDPFVPAVFSQNLKPVHFRDVPETAWYAPAVYEALERGLTSGTSAETFSPERVVSRAMFVAMLAKLQMRLDGGVVIDGETTFPDVPADAWFAPQVRWAAESGITRGSADGRFLPDQPVTRQQLVTFLRHYAEEAEQDTAGRAELRSFPDCEQVAPYAESAMSWAVSQGILQGDLRGYLHPAGTANRAQAIQILVRFMDWLQS